MKGAARSDNACKTNTQVQRILSILNALDEGKVQKCCTSWLIYRYSLLLWGKWSFALVYHLNPFCSVDILPKVLFILCHSQDRWSLLTVWSPTLVLLVHIVNARVISWKEGFMKLIFLSRELNFCNYSIHWYQILHVMMKLSDN